MLMTRIVHSPDGARPVDLRLIALGILFGLGALTRNETAWLALIWVVLAWRSMKEPRVVRARAIGVVAIVALIVFAPWATGTCRSSAAHCRARRSRMPST
jgi:4-amino-4-deoxy-L-arabinose transferase-like glycosyltransferase